MSASASPRNLAIPRARHDTLPFATLEWPHGIREPCGIIGVKERLDLGGFRPRAYLSVLAESSETGHLIGDCCMMLHEAIVDVLRDCGNQFTTTREVADEIARRGTYVRSVDGQPPSAKRIAARVRVSTYRHLFEENGSRIRLSRR